MGGYFSEAVFGRGCHFFLKEAIFPAHLLTKLPSFVVILATSPNGEFPPGGLNVASRCSFLPVVVRMLFVAVLLPESGPNVACRCVFFAGRWSECCLSVFLVAGALGGCCRLCCVGASGVIGPLAIQRARLVAWLQERFLHDGPAGMCCAMCRRGSGSNSHRRMVDICVSTNPS